MQNRTTSPITDRCHERDLHLALTIAVPVSVFVLLEIVLVMLTVIYSNRNRISKIDSRHSNLHNYSVASI